MLLNCLLRRRDQDDETSFPDLYWGALIQLQQPHRLQSVRTSLPPPTVTQLQLVNRAKAAAWNQSE
jgi:hypothetical protein